MLFCAFVSIKELGQGGGLASRAEGRCLLKQEAVPSAGWKESLKEEQRNRAFNQSGSTLSEPLCSTPWALSQEMVISSAVSPLISYPNRITLVVYLCITVCLIQEHWESRISASSQCASNHICNTPLFVKQVELNKKTHLLLDWPHCWP